ncbi:pectinesterase [Ranunculus cassubicifolius]
MGFQLFVALLFLSFFSSPAPVVSYEVPTNVKQWCSETPYPKPCEFFFSQRPDCSSIKDKHAFKKMAIEIALDRAARADDICKGLKFNSKKEKAAWDDCVELYDDILEKLNETITKDGKCTQDDSQTWLSAALTNLDTCWTGFQELGVTDHLYPLIQNNNVSKLLCNTLEINKDTPQKQTYKDGYPTWVSPGDRKLLQSSAPASNAVVAKDGSGNYNTIQAAITAAGSRSGSGRWVIYVKAGVYSENVVAGNSVKNVMLVGDGIGKTIITGSRSVGGGSTTFNSATFIVTGSGFIARDITFRNTAGAANHQAVAMRSGSDLSVFYKCSFDAFQDTLYVHSQRQFYRECDVYGTVDFIFGNAAVVLQSCNIYCRKPMSGQQCTITAQGRTDPNENTGISIYNSNILATSDLGSTRSWLGRPWKQYSRTVFMTSNIGGHIQPGGWLPWDGNFALSTLYYGEYNNRGAGASTANRVNWGGYRVLTATEATRFTVGNFIAGGSWLPATGVPFTSGL